jgi:hypothetical protein
MLTLGQAALFKPGCGCCEGCPCRVTLRYEVRGWDKTLFQVPKLSFITVDCNVQQPSGFGEVSTLFEHDWQVIFRTHPETLPGPTAPARFSHWRINLPGEENPTRNPNNPAAVQTSESTPCDIVATAMYDVDSLYDYRLLIRPALCGLFFAPNPGQSVSPEGFTRDPGDGFDDRGTIINCFYVDPRFGGPPVLTVSFPIPHANSSTHFFVWSRLVTPSAGFPGTWSCPGTICGGTTLVIPVLSCWTTPPHTDMFPFTRLAAQGAYESPIFLPCGECA